LDFWQFNHQFIHEFSLTSTAKIQRTEQTTKHLAIIFVISFAFGKRKRRNNRKFLSHAESAEIRRKFFNKNRENTF